MPSARPASQAATRLLTALCGLAAATAWAQAPLPREAASAPRPGGPEQKIERIHHEDAGSRIDELRVGGETKNITVQPKGDAPPYTVAPQGSNRNPSDTDRDRSGQGGWNLFKF